MQIFTKILSTALIFLTILCSCSKSNGDKYLGTWKSTKENNTIIVTKAGETAYTINYGGSVGTATYKDGNLVAGMLILSYSKGKLICYGNEYEKVE